MQKRELGKAAGGAAPSPAPKRGRPFGSTAAAAAAAAVAGDAAAPSNLLGPSLQIQSNFAGPPPASLFLCRAFAPVCCKVLVFEEFDGGFCAVAVLFVGEGFVP